MGELDTRGSHFYLAKYWARALADQDSDSELSAIFEPVAAKMEELEGTIVDELVSCQGPSADIGGYYRPDPDSASRVMRPAASLNGIIDSLL